MCVVSVKDSALPTRGLLHRLHLSNLTHSVDYSVGSVGSVVSPVVREYKTSVQLAGHHSHPVQATGRRAAGECGLPNRTRRRRVASFDVELCRGIGVTAEDKCTKY